MTDGGRSNLFQKKGGEKMKFKRRGFTLIELIVVIIIVGILASVAIPMMRGNIEKAKKSEAQAIMGTIRVAQKAYYAENQTTLPGTISDLKPYLQNTDIDGKYFINTDFTINATSGSITCATARGATTEIKSLPMTLYWNGQGDTNW